jgi:hypothetical protein
LVIEVLNIEYRVDRKKQNEASPQTFISEKMFGRWGHLFHPSKANSNAFYELLKPALQKCIRLTRVGERKSAFRS